MLKQNLHTKQQFRFKHWSRKGYAVFVSLGRQISIGRIISSVAILLSGIGEAVISELFRIFSEESEEEELDSILTEEEYVQLVTVPVAECGVYVIKETNY